MKHIKGEVPFAGRGELGGSPLATVQKCRAADVRLEGSVVDDQPAATTGAACRSVAVLKLPGSELVSAHLGRRHGDAIESYDLIEQQWRHELRVLPSVEKPAVASV